MAKLKVLGDSVMITIDLTAEDYEKVKNYAPEALKVLDTEKNEVFGISMGDAHWSKYGVAFCNTDADGKLFMTMNNPVGDHSDPVAEKKAIKEKYAQTIYFLETIEKNFAEMKAQLDALEQNAERSIEMN